MRSPLKVWKPRDPDPYDAQGSMFDPLLCRAEVFDGDGRWSHWSQCSRKPKTERPATRGMGGPKDEELIKVCGFHASVYDRAVAKAEAADAANASAERDRVRLEKVAAKIGVLTDLEAEVEESAPYNKPWAHRPTGRIKIDAEKLLNFLARGVHDA